MLYDEEEEEGFGGGFGRLEVFWWASFCREMDWERVDFRGMNCSSACLSVSERRPNDGKGTYVVLCLLKTKLRLALAPLLFPLTRREHRTDPLGIGIGLGIVRVLLADCGGAWFAGFEDGHGWVKEEGGG